MLTSSGYSAISPIAPRKVYRTLAGRDSRAQSAQGGSKFDSVTLSASGQDNRFMGLVSKLSQEVRAAATTTGTVAALREQVGAGEYQVDPHAIARSLLFVWEA